MKLAVLACVVCLLTGIAIGAAVERWLGRRRFKREVLLSRPDFIPKKTGQKWSEEL